MIHIRQQPQTMPYLQPPVEAHWIKIREGLEEKYRLEAWLPDQQLIGHAGWRNGGSERPDKPAHARIALLDSGALLASFPLLGALPGKIQPDAFTVWFMLDAPIWAPAGLFGKEITIPSGRHLMAQALDAWLVFFRPYPVD